MSSETTKSILAIITIGAIVGAFFLNKLSPEYTTGIFSLIIAHYFESQKTALAVKHAEEKDVEIQSLRSNVEALNVKRY